MKYFFSSSVVDALPFSITWCGNHPDLHSFPTRRSSDLRRVVNRSRALALEINKIAQYAALTEFGIKTPNSVRDRKSTRLNSSHVSISYAVFCLKKKSGRECAWFRFHY